jgi:hypothetical protein
MLNYPTVSPFDEPNQTICPQDWLYWYQLIVNLAPLPLSFHPSQSNDCLIEFFRKSKYLPSGLFECLAQ